MKKRRRKKKISPITIVMIILLLIAVILMALILVSLLMDNRTPRSYHPDYSTQQTEPIPDIYSETMLLFSLEENKTISSKNADKIAYPASLTKIMTTLVLCEELDVSNQYFTMTYDIYEENQMEFASTAGIFVGDEVLGTDLLYGTMLPSGADAVLMLVYGLGLTQADFAQLMNAKAKEIGLENTHFTNPTGLHNPQQYTTANDMDKLLRYALKNETFRDIYTTNSHTTQPSLISPPGYYFSSTTFSILQNRMFAWGDIIGGKTGYTQEAGLNLTTLAKDNNNNEYILITMGAPGSPNTEPFHFFDAYTLYEHYLTK